MRILGNSRGKRLEKGKGVKTGRERERKEEICFDVPIVLPKW